MDTIQLFRIERNGKGPFRQGMEDDYQKEKEYKDFSMMMANFPLPFEEDVLKPFVGSSWMSGDWVCAFKSLEDLVLYAGKFLRWFNKHNFHVYVYYLDPTDSNYAIGQYNCVFIPGHEIKKELLQ
jgi:hypothetical protein